ncbi:MAG: rhodanese-like domain-containing protein [Bacteroides sp.]|nr:rhodanese-like domain-containing protein [Bacteroides sp.]
MGYKDLDVKDFAQYIKEKDVQLLDVRTPEEYKEMHISGAINVNWLGKDFLPSVARMIKRGNPIAVYCRSGRRSEEAGHELASMGYEIVNLLGGILAWVEAGEPVVS